MPTISKITAEEATAWGAAPSGPPPTQAELCTLLHRLAGADRRGLTRIDIAGEHAWRARIYTRGIEIPKQFSDSRHGGAEGALRAALAWRDHARRLAGAPQERRGPKVRIVRAEGRRNRGWLAYTPRGRRYFADGKHGGVEGARRAAEGWVGWEHEEDSPAIDEKYEMQRSDP